jgi:hypothetical protein
VVVVGIVGEVSIPSECNEIGKQYLSYHNTVVQKETKGHTEEKSLI